MAIGEQSVFEALELSQLAVIVGDDVCRSVRRSNPWVLDLLPNTALEGDRTHLSTVTTTRKQRWIEWLLLLPPFRPIENWERRRSMAKLQRQAARRDAREHSDTTSFTTEVCKDQRTDNATAIKIAWNKRFSTD